MNDNGYKIKRKESSLYKPILEFLNSKPYTFAWRSGNHAVFDFKRQIYRKKSGEQQGMADICAVIRGSPVAIEVKSESGKVSPEQTRWLKRFAESGGQSWIVTSLDDVAALWLEVWEDGGNGSAS